MSFFAKDKQVRLRLCLDPKERFPEKLYDVANDNFLIKWDDIGESVVVDPDIFTENVLKCYPGFLQISTFANLRRLFREYGFMWKLNEDGTFEFSHESFICNQRHLLDDIYTRRKSFYRQSSHIDQMSISRTPPSLQPLPKVRRRRSLRRAALLQHEKTTIGSNFLTRRPIDQVSHESELSPFLQEPPLNHVNMDATLRSQLDPSVLDVYIRNELSEEELLQLIERHDGILARLNNNQTEEMPTPTIGNEWMYRVWDEEAVFDESPVGLFDNGTQYSGYFNIDIDRQNSEEGRELQELKNMDNMYCFPSCNCRCHQM